jgi:hypothetical protein
MTRQEALNIAWHARVNGLQDIKPEHMLGALAVLESLAVTASAVEALPARWRRRTHTPKNQTMPRIYEAHGREQQDTACADELEAELKGPR